MKRTKEQLLIELTRIRQSHEGWVSGDERKRKEFAKAFNWYKNEGSYSAQHKYGELRLPSWEEIFVELGKKLALKDFYDLEGNVSELEFKLEDLENKIKKEIHPNL